MNDRHRSPSPAPDDTEQLVEAICAALENKKGEHVAVLDVRGHSSLTDWLVLASGSSPPHLKGMRNDLLQTLKARGIVCLHKAGEPESGWMVLDYGIAIIHLFLPAMRTYYALEDIWTPHPPRVASDNTGHARPQGLSHSQTRDSAQNQRRR